jgi:hypothetical protein
MAQSPDARRSRSARQAIGVAAAAVVFLAAIALVLIATGAFDPQPLGPLIQTDKPGRQSTNEAGERNFAVPAPWFAGATPDSFSVRLAAAYIDGELDSGYGLALGDDSGHLVVALSPLGYASIWEESSPGEITYHLPWQTWPHIRTGEADNEIWLNVERSHARTLVTARINREVIWQGVVEFHPDTISLYQSTFDTPVTTDFRALEWFAGP